MVTEEELRSYIVLSDEVKDLQECLRELLEEKKNVKATSFGSAPAGSAEADKFANTMIRFETLERQYIHKVGEKLDQLMKIERAINKLPERERMLIRYRYIDGYSWINIAAKMNYSWKQTHRIHEKALELLKDDTQ